MSDVILSCGQPHSEEEILAAAARLTDESPGALVARVLQGMRKTRTGGTAGGRPKSRSRCPCGKFTKSNAKKRGHRCAKKKRAKVDAPLIADGSSEG